MPWLPPPPPLKALARQLLALEAASAKTGEDAATLFRVCERLRRPLSTLAGSAGFRSLLSRALALAGNDVRWLKAVHIDANGSLDGLDAGRLSDDQIAQGEAALVAQLIGLLETFIGEALTLHLLREAWPDASLGGPNSELEQDDHG